MQESIKPNIDLQDIACTRKNDLKDTAKGRQEQNEEHQGDRRSAGPDQQASWRLDNAVTLSVVTLQIL